ncbi:hypothetical protein DFH06DRAFT_1210444 [Mycena polygramma]|nr:hypothetical protein DFH06DRAFT_1210444 [Mycena polygramma]
MLRPAHACATAVGYSPRPVRTVADRALAPACSYHAFSSRSPRAAGLDPHLPFSRCARYPCSILFDTRILDAGTTREVLTLHILLSAGRHTPLVLDAARLRPPHCLCVSAMLCANGEGASEEEGGGESGEVRAEARKRSQERAYLVLTCYPASPDPSPALRRPFLSPCSFASTPRRCPDHLIFPARARLTHLSQVFSYLSSDLCANEGSLLYQEAWLAQGQGGGTVVYTGLPRSFRHLRRVYRASIPFHLERSLTNSSSPATLPSYDSATPTCTLSISLLLPIHSKSARAS